MEPVSFTEALQRIRNYSDSLKPATETIQVRSALRRVLSAPVFANQAHPQNASAAMDGIVVNSLAIPDALVRLRNDQWQRINTGELVPEGFNAVVKIEDVSWEGEVPVLSKKPDLFQNVRRIGEDFSAGTLLLAQENQLQSQDISAILAGGVNKVGVYKRPVVSFIPTGSELVLEPQPQDGGKIVESNSSMIAGLIEMWGGVFQTHDPVPDDPDDLAQMIRFCIANSQIVIVSAGTSLGTRDLTKNVVQLLGKVILHGVHMSPAKPVLFGEVGNIPVLGLPGYPAAAYVAAYCFLRHLVCALSRVKWIPNQAVLISPEDLPEKAADHFYRVQIYDVDGNTYARKISGGAGSVLALSQMDGFMHVPPGVSVKKRDGVRVDIIRNRRSETFTIRGTFDPVLMRLFDLFRKDVSASRLLFWRASAEDAFQSIVERNAHLAVLNIAADGPDVFQQFSRQLQENMLRYRVFTRTIALIFSGRPPSDTISSLPKSTRVMVPTRNSVLWELFLQKFKLANIDLKTMQTESDESALVETLRGTDAVFADIRFLMPSQHMMGGVNEHLDLVVSETYAEFPAIRKLIEILLSDEFAMWVESSTGCSIRSRGLIT